MSKKEKYIEYYDNGKKSREKTHNRYGSEDGKWTYWFWNGQKRSESTYDE